MGACSGVADGGGKRHDKPAGKLAAISGADSWQSARERFSLNAAMGWKTQRRKGAESAEEWGKSPRLHRRTQQVNIFRSAMAP